MQYTEDVVAVEGASQDGRVAAEVSKDLGVVFVQAQK